MIQSTLCYLEKDDKYLMMHRTKKKNDMNIDKWIGVGGKLEYGETPFECARREIKEETNLTAKQLKYRGIVTFVSNEFGTEYMHLFTCLDFEGELTKCCNEGDLVWVDKNQVSQLPIWEGDKIFFDLLDNEDRFFSLKLVYSGNDLVEHSIVY